MKRVKITISCLLLCVASYGQQINGSSSNITVAEIRHEFSKYPSGVVEKYLKKLDIKECGTAGIAHAFMGWIEISPSLSKKEFIETFHHEFSSILLHEFELGKENVPINKHYDYYHKLFWKLNGPLDYDKSINYQKPLTLEQQKYFIGSTYAMSNFENDWNMICETIFTTGVPKVTGPVLEKINLVKEFLSKVDPNFSPTYFEKL